VEAFNIVKGIVAPLDRANVDTDAIIPKQFLKSVKRSGFGPNLFDEWRYLDHGEPGMDNSKRPLNPDFVLNQSRYRDAKILLVRDNFGCGSSREHAVWALLDYGFRAVIGPSFADIFYNNCFKNGVLPVVLAATAVDHLFTYVGDKEGFQLTVDLPAQTVSIQGGESFNFEIDAFRKNCLLNGLDEIGLTLESRDDIKRYEEKRRHEAPWLFDVTS
jgi:3-isopropylmalate/(R)-2-methylmalate dehydratase small subunit